MGITNDLKPQGILQGLKLGHLTAVAGIALATSAALVLGGWQSEDLESPTTARTVHAERTSGPDLAKWEVVFYIVGSQAQADYARFMELEGERARMTVVPHVASYTRDFRIVVVTNAEEEDASNEKIADFLLNAENYDLVIHDLRRP